MGGAGAGAQASEAEGVGTKTFVFDMDGVIWRGRQPMPRAAETVAALEGRGHRLFYLTNNSRLRRITHVGLLRDCGITATADQILTSGYAVRIHLERVGVQGKACFAVGGDGLVEELQLAGLRVDTDPGIPPPGVGASPTFSALIRSTKPRQRYDYAVVGLDKEFTYAKLAAVQAAILDGAEFIASNLDPTFPAEDGRLMPGCGSIVAAVREATGREPQFYGKPKTLLLETIMERTGATKADIVVVGDRLDSDILMANRAGVASALVLTGVSSRADVEQAPPEMRPTHIFESLGPALVETLG
jgi:phosphoglycolate/pyridoxal phosphate phosphatase family enzyme